MFGFGKKKPSGPAPRRSNADLRREMAKGGDDGRAIRRVVHTARPAEKGMNAAKHEVRRIVTGIADVRFTETPEMPGVVFEQRREVASAEFDQICERIERTLDQRGWIYEGWTCPDPGPASEARA